MNEISNFGKMPCFLNPPPIHDSLRDALHPMDYSTLIAKNRNRFGELEDAVGDPNLFSDPKRAREILREHRRIKETLELWDRLESTKKQLEENQVSGNHR